jgi:hypothetical protein
MTRSAWHDGDARATIATLIANCAYLRHQMTLGLEQSAWTSRAAGGRMLIVTDDAK